MIGPGHPACGLTALLTLLLTFFTAGCSLDAPDHPTIQTPTGTAAFANYVAIGSSLTAGFMDGALHISGQAGSFPALIARQAGLSTAPGPAASFTQPWVASPGIGSTSTGDPRQVAGVLYWTGTGIDILGTTPLDAVPDLLLGLSQPIPYSNLGVPGATALDLAGAVDAGSSQSGNNPYFDFILRNPDLGNHSQLQQGINRGPTLVTLTVGGADILGGVTSGEPRLGQNITPPAVFAALFENLLTSLEEGVRQITGHVPTIVTATIIDRLPYFVPQPIFDSLAGAPIPTVETDIRAVLLPALAYLQGGGALPLAEEFTLDAGEWNVFQNAVAAYNSHIAAICAAHGAPVADLNSLFRTLAEAGVDGLTGDLFIAQRPFPDPASPATAYSLDGLHPNNKGYGLIANAFIAAINRTAGTRLAPVSAAALPWDPTYGAVASPPTADGAMTVSVAAADAMGAIHR